MPRWGLAVGWLLAMTGCGRSCTCVTGERAYEQLDGKVKVELVRTASGGGKGSFVPTVSFWVRIHTEPSFDVSVACESVDLAEDAAGKNVAFRCRGTTAWTVVRLRRGAEHVEECDAPVGVGSKPDFAALAPVVSIADKIVPCLERDGRHQGLPDDFAMLVRAISEDSGATAAALFVERLVDRPSSDPGSFPDRWEQAFAALQPAGRDMLLAKLCVALRTAGASDWRYVRAARTCPLAPDGLIETVAKQRLEATFASSKTWTSGLGAFAVEFRSAEWAALLTPPSAAPSACRAVSSLPIGDDRLRIANAVIAKHRVRCEEPGRSRIAPRCTPSLLCDAGVCLPDEISARLRNATDAAFQLDAGLRTQDPLPEDDDNILAAAYAQGPLEPGTTKRLAQLGYAFSPDAGESCMTDIVVGAPCRCPGLEGPSPELCALPTDGGTLTIRSACDVHADANRRTLFVTRACARAGYACGPTACCAPMRCVRNDAGIAVCAQ